MALGLSKSTGDLLTAEELNEIAAAVDANETSIGALNGYMFQNSHYYVNGNTHDDSPDVQEDVDPATDCFIKFSHPTDNGNFAPCGMTDPYDSSTGVFTLSGVSSQDFLMFRFQVDIEPLVDESSADLIINCVSPLGFSFDIKAEIAQMSQGAGDDYNGLVNIPVFVGDSLADNGTPATITPRIVLNNTTGNVKPVGFTLFGWS